MKPDFIRTPDSGNTIVDANLKVSRSLIIPAGDGFSPDGLQDTAGHIYFAKARKILQLYADGVITEFAALIAFATVATTGEYEDLLHKPDLSVYAFESDLAAEVQNRNDAINAVLNTIAAMANQKVFDNTAQRDAYNVSKLPFSAFITDDGDGKWALYQATTTGINATYVKLSDPDLLNAAMSAMQIATAYESVAGVNRFTNELKTKLVNLQDLGTTSQPTFAGATLKGIVQLGSYNLDGFNFAPYINKPEVGFTLVGQNHSQGGGETDFICVRNGEGLGAVFGGFRFLQLNNDGSFRLLLDMNGDTGAITVPGVLVVTTVNASAGTPSLFAVYDPDAKQFKTATAAQVATALGIGSGTSVLTSDNEWTGANQFDKSPTVPTVTTSDNSTKAASTAFVKAAMSAAGVGTNGEPAGGSFRRKIRAIGSNYTVQPDDYFLLLNGIPTAPYTITLPSLYYPAGAGPGNDGRVLVIKRPAYDTTGYTVTIAVASSDDGIDGINTVNHTVTITAGQSISMIGNSNNGDNGRYWTTF